MDSTVTFDDCRDIEVGTLVKRLRENSLHLPMKFTEVQFAEAKAKVKQA